METLVVAPAVALAKAVLETLVGWAGTAMADKAALVLRVQKDVRYIHDELPMMHAFLMASSPAYTVAAGFVNRTVDDLQKQWVKQLRDLAFDIEDGLLDFMLLKGPSAKLPGVAGQIAELRARVQALHERNHQYYAFVREDRSPRHDQAHDDSDSDPALKDEWRRQAIIGRDGDKRALTKLVPHPQNGVTVVAVWGNAGVGKSSLARMLYDDTDIIKHFNHRAWVTMPHPLEDADEFGRLLQEQIGFDREDADEFGRLLQERIGLGREKRCLVVVDDVSSHEEWEHVSRCLDGNHAGGQVVVLVTTQQRDVARRCARENDLYQLKPLPENEALKLLCQKVYKDAKYRLPNDMVKQAKFVLERCRGRPLAIAAIGGILANGPKTSSEWTRLKEYLMPELQSEALDVKRVISLKFEL